ncbi:esterase [Lentibacillus populi]|uniref:Esterase n=1 Tax=Lentibacillus populi TaxID=1827502 RepID=A0A9W5X4Q1_9BACI|nr:alpha/beta hydrolase [Lentibacillus populi]GGB37580.1 esterase [Lentibacillus populi]
MKTTFIYKSTTSCEIKGDFYPVEEKQAPLVVYIHGGGLIWGSRNDIMEEQVSLYNQGGFNVCSVDYRLAPEAKLPQIAEDIRDALIWLKERGKDEYDFDQDRIAVIGSSAGGFLALLSGTFQVRPKVIVSFYGYGDIIADWYTKPSMHFMKMKQVPETLAKQLIQSKPVSEVPIERRYAIYLYCRQQGKWNEYVSGFNPLIAGEKLRPYCPVKNIDANYPATLLLHGDKDKDVPYKESVKMSEALTSFGVKNTLITIPNGEHSFDQNMQKPVVVDAFRQVIAFLKENL